MQTMLVQMPPARHKPSSGSSLATDEQPLRLSYAVDLQKVEAENPNIFPPSKHSCHSGSLWKSWPGALAWVYLPSNTALVDKSSMLSWLCLHCPYSCA